MIPRHIQRIKSFLAMDIVERLEKRRGAGRPTISFSLGEPDVNPPEAVRRACVAALAEDFTKYTSTQGLSELRDAISKNYARKYGVHVDPDQILITGGTSPALLLVFSVLLEAGDNVIISNPHYPCYPAFIEYLRGRVNEVKVFEEEGFQYRPHAIQKRITPRTRAILINSPSNPTGTLLPEESLKAIADLVGRNRWIVSDEIYHSLVYKGRERSILEFTDKAFVLNGFSKAYAMTGYRLGFVIAPRPFVKTMRILHQNLYISANSFVQRAGIAALQEGENYLEKIRGIFNERRTVMLEGTRELGFSVAVEPTGAFYVFANAKRFTKSSHKFALDLLEHTDVGVTPGIDFGSGGEGYLRFSYATSVEKIREGLDRIGTYIQKKGI